MSEVRHYLVTGGAGFIGSHLTDALLAAGHRVTVLDDLSTGRLKNLPPGITFLSGDVTDPAMVNTAVTKVDGVFHLAAIASVARGNEDWPGTHRVNQTGTILLLDAARTRRLPVVYASSAAVYGNAGARSASEDMTPAPLTAYGADKLGSELHARVATLVHGIPTLGFRFFNVYGPRQDPNSPYSGVISIFSRRIRDGLGVTLHGGGEQTRDFVHVADVVAHLQAGMSALLSGTPLPPVLNLCTGQSVSIRDVAIRLAQLQGIPLEAHMGPTRPGDIRDSRGDPSLTGQVLGMRTQVTLADGLATLST